MTSRVSRRWPLISIGVFAVAVAILFAMGRPAICRCGTLALWGTVGPRQSQMLADWYSFSHIVHGLLFFGFLWLVARRLPVAARFTIALIIESAWEIAENSPAVIDRYREATIALGYSGDSILNSASDIAMMALGFFAARKLPLWPCIGLVVLLEMIPLLAIRDNLTLNVLMLVHPTDAILAWQAGS